MGLFQENGKVTGKHSTSLGSWRRFKVSGHYVRVRTFPHNPLPHDRQWIDKLFFWTKSNSMHSSTVSLDKRAISEIPFSSWLSPFRALLSAILVRRHTRTQITSQARARSRLALKSTPHQIAPKWDSECAFEFFY